jgi:hypothetical protein
VIGDPMYVGQSPKSAFNFEIVNRVGINTGIVNVLVAMALVPNTHGNYHIRSSYLIDEGDLDTRRRTMRLKWAK